ncbi:MAG: sugar-binding transcriptional regulator [Anaerolineales bacterium]|jgi:deoxyribonucleoside regulator
MTNHTDRDELLAFVAEKYFLDDLRQSDIAEQIGVTRSAVSRMLTEAREKGIVEIIVHYPFHYNREQESELQNLLDLKYVSVLDIANHPDYGALRKKLGKVASRLLADLIQPGDQIGVAWGTTVQATIEAFEATNIANTKVVQLVGVLGSTRHSYSAQTLVERLAEKIGGEGIYLYSPFIVENERTAASLLDDPTVEESITRGEQSDIALVGIGTTKPEFCSLFRGDHISQQELDAIRSAGAVGDVCAIYYDIAGELARTDFHQRRIGVSPEGLKNIPIRLGVGGSPEKAEAIFGAAMGGFINALVTDSSTAELILELARTHCQKDKA